MARTTDLEDFLEDIATAIKYKLNNSSAIPADQFDTKIMAIETVGTYENKSITISANGSQTVLPSAGYDAIESITINTQVPVNILQSKNYEFTQNTEIVLSPETGYDGFNSVGIKVNVTDPEYDTNLELSYQILGIRDYYEIEYD